MRMFIAAALAVLVLPVAALAQTTNDLNRAEMKRLGITIPVAPHAPRRAIVMVPAPLLASSPNPPPEQGYDSKNFNPCVLGSTPTCTLHHPPKTYTRQQYREALDPHLGDALMCAAQIRINGDGNGHPFHGARDAAGEPKATFDAEAKLIAALDPERPKFNCTPEGMRRAVRMLRDDNVAGAAAATRQ